MGQVFTFRVAPLVDATYTLEADELVFRQGLRHTRIPIAGIRAFAVEENRPFLGLPASALKVRVERDRGGKVHSMPFDPRAAACADLLAALRARVPVADATAETWDHAAARLGVAARPWWNVFKEPMVVIGIVVLAAAAFANGDRPRGHGRAYQLGYATAGVITALLGVAILVIGVRRYRRRNRPSVEVPRAETRRPGDGG